MKKTLTFLHFALITVIVLPQKDHAGSYSNDCSFYSTASAAKQRLTKDCEWGFSFPRNPSEQSEFSCKFLHVAQKVREEKKTQSKAEGKVSEDYAKPPVQQYTCTCLLCFACERAPVRGCFRLVLQPWIFLTCCANLLIYSYTVTRKSDSTGLTGRCVNRDDSQPLTPPAVRYRAGFQATGSSYFEIKLKIYLSCHILCLFIGRFYRIPTVPKAAFLFVRL